MSKPIPIGQTLTQTMDENALVWARKWNLVREDGTVKCCNGWCTGDATLPTLECKTCREKREAK